MPRRRRNSADHLGSPAGLSFLDVLCCGLGASVLLLLIVKHSTAENVIFDSQAVISREVADLEQQTRSLQAAQERYARDAEATNAKVSQQRDAVLHQAATAEREELASYFDALRSLAAEEARSQSLDAAFAERVSGKQESPPPDRPKAAASGSGAVVGLDYAGSEKVAVLLDTSASMLASSLVEIVRLRSSDPRVWRGARKWSQAGRIALWAYESVRPDARVKLLSYSEGVSDLSGNDVSGKRLDWDRRPTGEKMHIANQQVLERKVGKGTDLDLALAAVSTLVPRPDRIVIITDGLPNRLAAGSRANGGISGLPGCKRAGSRGRDVVSGVCRLSIAIESVNRHSDRLSFVPIDVILLPLEGDSDAIRFYSLLSSFAKGRLLTPAPDWLGG